MLTLIEKRFKELCLGICLDDSEVVENPDVLWAYLDEHSSEISGYAWGNTFYHFTRDWSNYSRFKMSDVVTKYFEKINEHNYWECIYIACKYDDTNLVRRIINEHGCPTTGNIGHLIPHCLGQCCKNNNTVIARLLIDKYGKTICKLMLKRSCIMDSAIMVNFLFSNYEELLPPKFVLEIFSDTYLDHAEVFEAIVKCTNSFGDPKYDDNAVQKTCIKLLIEAIFHASRIIPCLLKTFSHRYQFEDGITIRTCYIQNYARFDAVRDFYGNRLTFTEHNNSFVIASL